MEKYSDFVVHDLNENIDSSFCMLIQTDGYPVKIDAWKDDFLKYDYIGAPWFTQMEVPERMIVGNGGFSIRSKRFLEESCKLPEKGAETHPEDVFLCREKHDELVESGVVFAPWEVARLFSVEDAPYAGQFGFHGQMTVNINKALGIFK